MGWLLVACATPYAPVPLPPGDERPQRVLRAWEALTGERTGLRARLRLAVDGDEGGGREGLRLRSRQRIVVARPARLRVEIEGLLGTTAAVLATDGARYVLLTAEGARESGPLHDGLLWQVAGLDLAPAEAVEAVLGAPGLEPGSRIADALALEHAGIRVRVAGARGEIRRVVDFDAEGRAIRLEVRGTRGLPGYVAHYAEYADLGAGGPFAHRVTLELAGASAHLVFQDVVLNPALSADIFRLGDPAAAGALEAEGG
jgi:hypothetical protein